MLHINSPLAGQHIPHNWEYANAAARTGAVGFTSADLKKLALQTDDYSLWVLTAVTPTWVQVGGPSQTFTNITVSGLETHSGSGDQEKIALDLSPFRTGSWAITASGALYTLLGEFAMWYWTHNTALDASGNFLGRDEAGICQLWVFTESGLIKTYTAATAAIGVVPTFTLVSTFDTTTGNYTTIGKFTGSLLGSATYSTLPSASTVSGQQYIATDVGLDGSIWYSNGTRWRPIDSQIKLYQDAIPIGLPPGNGSTTGLQFTNTTGAFTLTTTVFQNAYTGGIWLWMPIGAFDGTNPTSANFYWAVMSTTSAGQLYTATYQAGIPTGLVQATTTAARWLTQTTGADITARSVTVIGGSMGANGVLTIEGLLTYNNSANIKTSKIKAGVTTFATANPSTTVSFPFRSIIRNSGVQNANVSASGFGLGGSTVSNVFGAVDFSVNQTLSITLQLVANTDYLILEGSNVLLTPGF